MDSVKLVGYGAIGCLKIRFGSLCKGRELILESSEV